MQPDEQHDGPPIYEFGWWPEILGSLLTAGVIALLISLASGSL